jgi:hypothetical protein
MVLLSFLELRSETRLSLPIPGGGREGVARPADAKMSYNAGGDLWSSNSTITIF